MKTKPENRSRKIKCIFGPDSPVPYSENHHHSLGTVTLSDFTELLETCKLDTWSYILINGYANQIQMLLKISGIDIFKIPLCGLESSLQTSRQSRIPLLCTPCPVCAHAGIWKWWEHLVIFLNVTSLFTHYEVNFWSSTYLRCVGPSFGPHEQNSLWTFVMMS